MISETAQASRRFEFGRDTFAFANELVWDYETDANSQKITTRRSSAPRNYTHRCFVMTRSARQFFHHATFDPTLPPANEAEYRRLIQSVVASDPRSRSRETGRIVIPGFDSLYHFSESKADALMACCGRMWRSYLLRSHWRMVLPVSRRHQENMAAQLVRSLTRRGAAIVHVFRFPQLTINHSILLFGQDSTPSGLKFLAYDPNVPTKPTELTYQAAERAFHLPQNYYWPGGVVHVVETFCGLLY
jgi:hypothetical protein